MAACYTAERAGNASVRPIGAAWAAGAGGGRSRKWGRGRRRRGGGMGFAEEGFQAAVNIFDGVVDVIYTLTGGG